jgi:hypothetical protein
MLPPGIALAGNEPEYPFTEKTSRDKPFRFNDSPSDAWKT